MDTKVIIAPPGVSYDTANPLDAPDNSAAQASTVSMPDWLLRVYKTLTGKMYRQGTINALTGAAQSQLGEFFVKTPAGDAGFADPVTGLYFDGNSDVHMPAASIKNTGAFSVFRNGAQAIPNITNTTVGFNTVTLDQDNAIDLATGIWTPKRRGLYYISVCVSFDAPTVANSVYACNFVWNGTQINAASHDTGGSGAVMSVAATAIVGMNGTTDSALVQAFHQMGVAHNLLGARYATYFHGFKFGDI